MSDFKLDEKKYNSLASFKTNKNLKKRNQLPGGHVESDHHCFRGCLGVVRYKKENTDWNGKVGYYLMVTWFIDKDGKWIKKPISQAFSPKYLKNASIPDDMMRHDLLEADIRADEKKGNGWNTIVEHPEFHIED